MYAGYLRRHTWQYIIVDEGHRMKNAQSKFAQTLGTVYQSKHRLLLTGKLTPESNVLSHAFGLPLRIKYSFQHVSDLMSKTEHQIAEIDCNISFGH